MSRSYKKIVHEPNCNVSTEGMRKWKHMSTQIRRAREKAQTLTLDDDCTFPVKYQKSKGLDDWCGPHDGWHYAG